MPTLQSRLVPVEDPAEQQCGQAESQWHGQPLQGSPEPMGATYVPHLVSTSACHRRGPPKSTQLLFTCPCPPCIFSGALRLSLAQTS